MRKLIFTLSLILLIAVVACSHPMVQSQHYDTAGAEQMFELTNAARAAEGTHRLIASGILIEYAKAHSVAMAARARAFHSSLPDGIIAENVAAVPADKGWPAFLQRQFMASPDHRYNILDPRLKLLGVAAVISDGVAYVTEEFGITEHQAPSATPTCTPIVRTDCTYRLAR